MENVEMIIGLVSFYKKIPLVAQEVHFPNPLKRPWHEFPASSISNNSMSIAVTDKVLVLESSKISVPSQPVTLQSGRFQHTTDYIQTIRSQTLQYVGCNSVRLVLLNRVLGNGRFGPSLIYDQGSLDRRFLQQEKKEDGSTWYRPYILARHESMLIGKVIDTYDLDINTNPLINYAQKSRDFLLANESIIPGFTQEKLYDIPEFVFDKLKFIDKSETNESDPPYDPFDRDEFLGIDRGNHEDGWSKGD